MCGAFLLILAYATVVLSTVPLDAPQSLDVEDKRAFGIPDLSPDDVRQLKQDGSENSCNCGNRNEEDRIVGGEVAGIGEFPWRCGMFFDNPGEGFTLFCGCSIISRNFILTAAHCTNAFPGRQIYVDAGDYDLTRKDEIANQVIKVAEVIQHEQYDTVTHDRDISLLKLETPLNFTRTVGPICLPWKLVRKDYSHATVVASGSGTTEEGGQVSPVIRKVELPLISTEDCREYYSDDVSVQVTDNMICTYSPGKDACQGDSGSSIDMRDEMTGKYHAVGITSWGEGCARQRRPGVYTNLRNFLPWIDERTRGADFCER